MSLTQTWPGLQDGNLEVVLTLFFVGHLGSVPGFEARLGLDSVIPNLETVFFSSLRGSSGDLPDVYQLL